MLNDFRLEGVAFIITADDGDEEDAFEGVEAAGDEVGEEEEDMDEEESGEDGFAVASEEEPDVGEPDAEAGTGDCAPL